MDTNNYTFASINEGEIIEHSQAYRVDDRIYSGFIELFRDTNPIHVDDHYAGTYGFQSKLMHGAILNCFLSHFIGVVFPAKGFFLVSVDMRYLSPTYLDDEILIKAKVQQKVETLKVLALVVSFTNKANNKVVGRAKVQVKSGEKP